MSLRKAAPYIIVAAALFVAAGWYVDSRMPAMRSLSSFAANPGTPGPAAPGDTVAFQDYGAAPEFTGISHWLNSLPLTVASLRGKVVLVDFWTYSCINCIRTLPYVTKWYDTYQSHGLVVVGVHTPEFAFEKDTANVQAAIERFNIHYPVAQDNDYGTWQSYSNQYWPAEYLINQQGQVVYVHFGEGNYDHTENAIRSLLGLDTEKAAASTNDNLANVQSPEMYFGTARLENLATEQNPSSQAQTYVFPSALALNTFALAGPWQFSAQAVTLAGEQGKIRLKFHSGKLYLVAASPASSQLSVSVDGKPQPDVAVQASQLYTLFDSTDYSDHEVEITVQGKGFNAFTFTFG